ncbi:MAG: Crp/Fnr family transcriptional regulator [Bacteroidota bacterium]
MSEYLKQHIAKIAPHFEKELDSVLDYFKQKKIEKGEVIVLANESVDTFYFVDKGCLHLYYYDNDRHPQTIHFALENWWITEYNAFYGNPKAEFEIAAIEACELSTISKVEFDLLLRKFPDMAIYFNVIHMKAYGAALLKQKVASTTSKKDFHYYFMTHYPDFVSRIPDDILASYMGISIEEFHFFNQQLLS